MTTITIDRALLEQALEALDRVQPQIRGAIPQQDVEDAIIALRAALVEPMEPVNKTPAWWMNGLTATLMREGVNKHRAKEIAKGYWEAYCQVPMDEEEPK